MVIYNMFYEINKPICVSERLGLYLINPHKRDSFYSTVKEMLYKSLSQEKKRSKKYNKKPYNIKEILMSPYWEWIFNINENSEEKHCINEIVKKIVILVQRNSVGTIYDEIDEKRLHGFQIDEYSIEHKISMLQNWLPNISGATFSGILRDDEIDGLFSTNKYNRILPGLKSKINNFENIHKDVQNNLREIEAFRDVLDNYITEKVDFYKLDFIIDHLIEQTSHYQMFLSPLYIIEMLIVNSRCGIKEQFKEKIKYFYTEDNDDIKENIEEFASNVYEIRSKLVHGYFKNFEKELRKYKNKFMKGFWFDYYEFTENHWVLGNAAIRLDYISKNLVMALLKNKDELEKFKNDDKTSIYFKEKC